MRRPTKNVFLPIILTALVACGGDEPATEVGDAGDVTQEAPAPAVTDPAPAPAATGALIDPELATRDELMAVEHIDATLADALIAGRPYADMTEVDDVLDDTLSEEQRDQVYARLWKRIDLNAASDEEILLIPGIGDRMLHEFEEYRPYRAIEQFRREMGKYVDDEEVARMEQYVEIR
jgi:DNA uptake protein ComE-like DNA-binding protein